MDENSLRVRLVFEDEHILSKSQKSQGLKQSWLLINRTQHPNISQLSDHLLRHFNLNRSCPHGLLLSMDDFVLPPFESTSILKDKEIISVKMKGSKSSKTIRVADVDGTAEVLGIVETQLLANEEFDKESDDCLSESEEDEDAVAIEYTSGGNALSKKRKASERLMGSKKKKHTLAIPDGAKRNHLTNEIKSRIGDGVIVSKSHGKKENVSNAKAKEDSENTSESAGSSSDEEFAKCVKSDKHKENDKRIEDTSHAPTKKLPSRSARRKKAKRQWLRAMAKIGKKDVCDIKRPKQQDRRSKAEKKEVICQSKGLLHWRQSREGCNQYKKEDNSTILERSGHIRFDPLDEDEAVQKSQESMGISRGNEITTGMKEQRWGTEKMSSTQRKDNVNINKDHSDTSNIEKDIRISAPIDSEKLPPLPGNLPKEGYIIAYRLLELSSAWTTDPSESRVGRVLWYRPESRRIMLAPVPEYPVILEKFDGDNSAFHPNTSRYNNDGSLEIDYRALLDVRLVTHTDANSGNDATVKVDEGVVGNEDVVSNKGNGEPNMWEHFTKVLDTEKSELSENKWGSWSERASKSCPSYKAWKGSAAMARLGSRKGK